MKQLCWHSPISVTDHALARARERLGFLIERQEVRGEIRVAILLDRVSSFHPNWTRGGNYRTIPDDGHHYVWDENVSRCWVVWVAADVIRVKTVLLSDGERDEIAYRHRVRRGYRRVA